MEIIVLYTICYREMMIFSVALLILYDVLVMLASIYTSAMVSVLALATFSLGKSIFVLHGICLDMLADIWVLMVALACIEISNSV